MLPTNEVSKEKKTRKRREPAKLQDYAPSQRTGAESEDNTSNTIEYWRTTVYLRIIDAIIINVEKRFSEESLELAESVDNFFNLDEHKSLCFINTYKDILKISTTSLSAEMLVLKNSLPANFEFEDLKNQCHKSSFPNVYKLVQVGMTIPISSSTCERSFSAMHRLKNWLRTSLGQDIPIK